MPYPAGPQAGLGTYGKPSVTSSAYGAMSQALGKPTTGLPAGTDVQSALDKINANKSPAGLGAISDKKNESIGEYYDRVLGSGVRPSDGPSGAGAPSAKGVDYLYADLAKHYGFSKETAYQEALANTQYSRAVADMQRAGLNPASIFGSGKGHTAGDDIWPTSSSGGGGGGNPRRSSGGRKSSGNLFSTSAYSVISALGGIVGAAATKNAGGFWIGTSLAQGAMSALNAFSKWGR